MPTAQPHSHLWLPESDGSVLHALCASQACSSIGNLQCVIACCRSFAKSPNSHSLTSPTAISNRKGFFRHVHTDDQRHCNHLVLLHFQLDLGTWPINSSVCQRGSQPGIRALGSPFSSGSLALFLGRGGSSLFRLFVLWVHDAISSPALFSLSFYIGCNFFGKKPSLISGPNLLVLGFPQALASCHFHDTRVPASRALREFTIILTSTRTRQRQVGLPGGSEGQRVFYCLLIRSPWLIVMPPHLDRALSTA